MLLESYVKVIDVLGSFFDMLSMGFYTTMHWQTSGRLVQDLDVCTVGCRIYFPVARHQGFSVAYNSLGHIVTR